MTRRVRRRATATLAGLAAASLALSACGTGQDTGQQAQDGQLKVVASTSVWASVAEAVGGDAVEVVPLISDAKADPHSYESTPQDAAKVVDADLVVFNGGGYDEFVEQILSSTGEKTPVVQAFNGAPAEGHENGEPDHEAPGHEAPGHEAPGHEEPRHEEPGHEEPGHAQPAPAPVPAHEHSHEEHGHDHSVNEHIWYDLHSTHGAAERIADELARLQPGKAQVFHDGAARFATAVGGLEDRVAQIKAKNPGKKVIVTEPVAHYLVEAAGLSDITPESFVKAVEAENDPAPAAVAEIQNAVNSKQAAAVLYNPQTESPVTEQIRTKAQQNGTPVVEMTETPPAGKSYVEWMTSQVTALDKALASTP